MTKWFAFHIFINFVITSAFLPFLYNYQTSRMLSNDTTASVESAMLYVFFEICTSLHDMCFLNKLKNEFKIKTHSHFETTFNKKLCNLEWDKLRKLSENDIEQKKNKAKWSIIAFVDQLVSQSINMFPFLGYILYLAYLSPLSVIMYVGSITLIIVYYKKPLRNKTKIHNLWDKYWFFNESLFTETIHHRGEQVCANMSETISVIEEEYTKDRRENSKYMEIVCIIFNLTYVFNLYMFVLNMTSMLSILLYYQYTSTIRSNIQYFSNTYKQAQDTKQDYNVLESLLFDCLNKSVIPQVSPFTSLSFGNLHFTYSNEELLSSTENESEKNTIINLDTNTSISKKTKFGIEFLDTIVIKPGSVILLHGESGHGKSTFLDVICGIVPYSDYGCDVYYDDVINRYKFCAMSTYRIYAEQFERLNWRMSIYEIISGSDDINDKTERLVKESLCMAECQDFMDITENFVNPDKLNSIHKKNISPSGGQKGRIQIARVMYNLMQNIKKTKIVALDEIDKAVQAQTAIKLMTKLYNFCRDNDLIFFVVAHTTEIIRMDYDAILSFESGVIKKVITDNSE